VKEEMKHIEINNDGDENHKNVTVKIRNNNKNIDTSMNIIIQKGVNMVVIQTKDKAIAAKALEDGAKSITTEVTNGEKMYTIVQENTNKKMPENTLIFVDGKATTQKEMNAINPNTIQSVNVLKGESAVKKYGEKAANGVVEITLKKN
jgi:hypothetical protein